EFQRGAVRIAEVEPRAVDRAAAAILLKEYLDAFVAQTLLGGLVLVGVDHEGVVHAVRHFGRSLLNGRRPLDEQDADAAGIQEGDALVWLHEKQFAANYFGVELDALVDVAHRNTEVCDTLDINHRRPHASESSSGLGTGSFMATSFRRPRTSSSLNEK